MPQECPPRWAQDIPSTATEAPNRDPRQPKRPSNRPKGLPRWPRRPPKRLQNGPTDPEDRAPSKPPRGSTTAQRRLEVARKFFNHTPEKPKSSNLRPCRCDPERFSGLRCTRIRPHMRGKEGRGGLRCTVVRPWWRVLRSQTRAPLFFVQLLLRSQGGSREAQDALKKPARPPTLRRDPQIELPQVPLPPPKEFQNCPSFLIGNCDASSLGAART